MRCWIVAMLVLSGCNSSAPRPKIVEGVTPGVTRIQDLRDRYRLKGDTHAYIRGASLPDPERIVGGEEVFKGDVKLTILGHEAKLIGFWTFDGTLCEVEASFPKSSIATLSDSLDKVLGKRIDDGNLKRWNDGVTEARVTTENDAGWVSITDSKLNAAVHKQRDERKGGRL